MNCDRTRRLLSDYMAQAIAPEQAQKVREHLLGCAACTAELEELERVVRAAALLGERQVPRDCWPVVRARLLASSLASRAVWMRRRLATALAGAVAAAAIGAVVLLHMPQRPVAPPAGWASRPRSGGASAQIESEYLQAYAAFRDERLLASGDGVAIQLTNGD